MITTIWVKKIGEKCLEKRNVANLYCESYIEEREAERLKGEISNVPGVNSVDILYGSLCPITFPAGFKVRGRNPSDVFQRITSNGYAITKSSIKLD